MSFSACTAEKKGDILTIGYVEFPPFSYTNLNGQADGSLIELAKIILAKTGHQYEMVLLPSKRMMSYLSTGVVDAWISVSSHHLLSDIAIVGKQVIGQLKLNVYNLNFEKTVELVDLKNKTVILIRGYNYGGLIDYINSKDNNIKAFTTNTHHSAVNMLLAKRADYMLGYEAPVLIELKKQKIPNLQSNTILELPLYFVVSKKTLNAKKLLNEFEKTFFELAKE